MQREKKSLGCLTVSGLLVSLMTFLVVAGVSFARGGVMFSPGDLNAVQGNAVLGGVWTHDDLSRRCSACHAPVWSRESMSDRCLVCHQAILRDGENFHVIMLAQGEQDSCRQCHSDHNGRQASLTRISLDEFPHEGAGFSLAAHQTRANGTAFVCEDCHRESINNFSAQTCLDCHADLEAAFTAQHVFVFGRDCLACHDGVDRYGSAFDHNQLTFRLQGGHAQVACQNCHAGDGFIQALRSTPADCYDCHAEQDAHQGRLGNDCAACHTVDTWQEAAFDHAATDFPLTGGHAKVACGQCHPGQAGAFTETPTACFACHAADDTHQGRFGKDCAGCHTPESWQAADFDHSKAAFILAGAHAQVPCQECHQQGSGGTVFAGTPQECAACHEDPQFHLGLFSSDCAACHTAQGWSPAKFDQAHTFPVSHGARGPSECRLCHPDSLQTYTCYGCHEHNAANIEGEHREEGIGDFRDCVRCHATGREEEGERGDD
jgi:hypothetical protein